MTLTNSGQGTLSITGVAITGTDAAAFHLGSPGCGATLAAGASCSETVLYEPTSASPGDAASLSFTDNSGGQSASTQAISLTGNALAEVDSVTNFGDSITCGYYAAPEDGTGFIYSNEGYAGLFDAFVGAPSSNRCHYGDQAADMSRLWVPFFATPTANGNQLYTVMIGTNDALVNGTNPTSVSNYGQQAGAALAWLALPADAKVLANTVAQRTGNWVPDVSLEAATNFGLSSADAGASLTFSVHQAVAGHNLYVVYHVFSQAAAPGGAAAIAVDGVTQATVDESQNAALGMPTTNGTQDSYYLQTIPLGAAGQHTVSFTSVGAAGTTVSLLWAGVPQADYTTVSGAPRVLVGAITSSSSPLQNFVAPFYRGQMQAVVSQLTGDGLNVTIVPTDTALDPATDFYDGLHPNTAGHAKLAAVFEGYR